MPTQMESGKAFEYSLIQSLYDTIKDSRKIELIEDRLYNNTKKCFELFDINQQNEYTLASNAAIEQITKLEPRLQNPNVKNSILTISIQQDQQGKLGDVRDIISVNQDESWEIGFSAKNRHDAVKHSRLSDKIDFGKQWFGKECSSTYMKQVQLIFGELREMNPIKWRELQNKENDYYIPVLNSFEEEIHRLYKSNPDIPKLLVEYLLGKYDFYKIMKYERYTRIQGYNLHDTLNKKSKSVKPQQRVRKIPLPTEIVQIKMIKNNTIHMLFDKGWGLSFRIHNARTMIEPSLKFDITLISTPNNMYDDRVSW